MEVLFKFNGKLLKAEEIKADDVKDIFFKPAKYILENAYPVKIFKKGGN